MARTNETLVKAVLLRDYDLRRKPSLNPFITSASMIVDRLVTCAADKDVTFTDAELQTIESWVAAYRYTHNNPVYQSKSTDGRSASFVRQGNNNPYRQGATELDPTGCLEALLKSEGKRRVGFSWLGVTPSEARNFDDRS